MSIFRVSPTNTHQDSLPTCRVMSGPSRGRFSRSLRLLSQIVSPLADGIWEISGLASAVAEFDRFYLYSG